MDEDGADMARVVDEWDASKFACFITDEQIFGPGGKIKAVVAGRPKEF